MTIDFTCVKCEGSFELDAQDLIDGNEKLMCPHCDAKAPANLVEDFTSALTEMRTQVAALAKKFSVTMAIETEDLDADLEEEEDEAEDDEEADDDEDLDLDDDDDDVDEDEGEDVEDEDDDR